VLKTIVAYLHKTKEDENINFINEKDKRKTNLQKYIETT
jgi:hypothetical protein